MPRGRNTTWASKDASRNRLKRGRHNDGDKRVQEEAARRLHRLPCPDCVHDSRRVIMGPSASTWVALSFGKATACRAGQTSLPQIGQGGFGHRKFHLVDVA